MDDIGEVYLTTNWRWYIRTAILNKNASDNYQVKFRGYETAWMFIDKVQIGSVVWRIIMEPELQILNTPVFLPTPPLNLREGEIKFGEFGDSDRIKIGPNPVYDVLFIEENGEDIPFFIYSLNGNLLAKGQGNRFVASDLPTGIYVLRTENRPSVKFFKQ